MKKTCARKIGSGIGLLVLLAGIAGTSYVIEEKQDAKNAKSLVANFVNQEGAVLLQESEEIISSDMKQCSGEKVAKEIYAQGVNCIVIGDTIFTEESKLVSKVTFHVSREEAIDDYVTLYTDFDPNGEYNDVKIRNCEILEIMDVETRWSHPFEELYDYDFLWEESENKEKGIAFQLVPREKKED